MAYFDIGNFYECRNHKLGDEILCRIVPLSFFNFGSGLGLYLFSPNLMYDILLLVCCRLIGF